MPTLASLAVAALLAGALLQTAVPQSAGAEPAGPTLTYSWPTNVGPLKPASLRAQPDVRASQRALRAAGDDAGRWYGGTLARHRLDHLAGRAVYDFTLRPGVTFSDGTPFDAAAVKANVDAILANRSRHDWLDLTRQIDRAEVAGPPSPSGWC